MAREADCQAIQRCSSHRRALLAGRADKAVLMLMAGMASAAPHGMVSCGFGVVAAVEDEDASALARLRAELEPRRRRLLALGLLTERLAKRGIEPILVGGAALEFYTAGGYATTDVDLAMTASKEVHAVFAALGFEREGRYWHHAELDLLFEAPAPAGLPGEDSPRTETSVDGLRIVVIGIEDLLIDRLRAWVHWNSDEDGRWVRRLAFLYSERINWHYVLDRVAQVPEEANAARQLRKEVEQT